MIVTSIVHRGERPTEEQVREIREAEKMPIVYDEDSPKLTPAMEKAFRLAARNRDRYKAAYSRSQ